ncbi:hypothetical protein LZ554_005175 [Drepanopeziza brunnea f. sp. 'monogermtubi']|nr:hypothetical protein LZ554_005175 [Drepanopeziza brunnea f. sp. 'monogermtubi']
MRFSGLLAVMAMFRGSCGVASYDEYRDADVSQSGYLPNHNMDPNIVDSSAFGQIWKVPFNQNEQFYAKPLTYTPLAGGPQLLFLASNQNWIRTLDAKTGALINSRQVATPFLQSDLGCGDIANFIGIIGTPTIDPATDTVYFFAKTYIPNYRIPGNTGTPNGVYYFYAVNINTLTDVYPPVLIDGSVADNDPRKYFHGGVILQRPSLTQIGSVVYGSFGGHCDLFNYTGIVLGVDVNKAKIVTQFAVESGPLTAQTNDLLQNGGGGLGGIWMSGMSPASDGQRLFVVSGNGVGHENFGPSASGASGCRTLGESAINLAVDSSTGTLELADYFQPYDYIDMDGNDQDFGAGGLVLLDPATFSGGGIDRMAVTAGKNGKVYILNANNLGGYKLGPGKTDGIIQTIPMGKSVFGAAGSYPLEGGYMYVSPVGNPTYVYQLGFTSGGLPQFSQVAATNEISAGRVGVGVPTITSLNGQPGTAILWMTDPDVGIRAWYAVPQNGVMRSIKMPQVGGANKFQRPAFGDGRLYMTDSNGVLYCLGSPVNLPLNCTSPVDFGQVALGAKASRTVNCTAKVGIISLDGLEIVNEYFQASNDSLPKGPIAAGTTFSIPVTWDLTNASVSDSDNASYSKVTPGIKSTPLTLFTTNALPGYATVFPVSLVGTQVSTKPFLAVTPSTVDFGGIIVTDPNSIQENSGIITIANKGLSPLTITGYAYTSNKLDSKPIFVNSTVKNAKWDLGPGFTATTLPAIGSKIAPNTAVSIDADFYPTNGTRVYNTFWQVWSDGGSVTVTLEGSAATAPLANFSISDGQGGWLPQTSLTPLMDFGSVAPGSSSSREIRLCNNGGSSLQISKSKPPFGVFRISDPTMLHESQLIATGTCAIGEVMFVTNTEEYNQPDKVFNNSWTLNANDPTWGVHVVQITGTVVSNKIGPKNSNGSTVYEYLGCFKEAKNAPRLFPNEPLNPSQSNNNGICQAACLTAGPYAFTGTEFYTECWCGDTPPPLAYVDPTDTLCNYACPGDQNDRCGGNDYISVFYDPTKYIKGTDPSLYGPQTPAQVGNYNYQGCYSEGTNGRALAGLSPPAPTGGFTLESCMAGCQGYSYFGMEYANQCYCGNTLGIGAVNQTSRDPTVNGCNMVCAGNALEWCGGGNRLNLYLLNGTSPAPTSSASVPTGTNSASGTPSTPTAAPAGPVTVSNFTGWNYLGCYSEATNGRALNSVLLPIAGSDTDVETCATACAGYTYFGVEYGSECYCGNQIREGSVVQTSPDPNVNGCSVLCAANPLEYCGGGNRLNVYQVAPFVTSSSSVSSTRSSSSSILSSSTRSSSAFTLTPSSSSSRASSSSSKSSLTLPTTASTSSSKSSATSVSSTKSSTSSRLSTSSGTSTTSRQYSTLTKPSSSSTISSPQVPSSTSKLTSSATSSATALPTLHVVPSAGLYNYFGCYTEGTGVRALGSATFPSDTNTIESCVAACSPYKYAGAEYGRECWCSDSLGVGSVLAPDSDCSMRCAGDQYEYCGAGNRLSVYIRNGTGTASSSSSRSQLPSSSSLQSSATSSRVSTSTIPSSSKASVSSILSSSSVRSSSRSSSQVSTTPVRSSSSSKISTSTSSVRITSTGSTPSSISVDLSSSSRISTLTSKSSSSSGTKVSTALSTQISSASPSSSSKPGTSSSVSSISTSTRASSGVSTSVSRSATSSSLRSSSSTVKASSSSTLRPSSISPTTSPTSSKTSSSTKASTSTSAPLWTGTPTPGQEIGSYQYLGCANEIDGRALPGAAFVSGDAMTVESCQAFCATNNYALSGIEYASECYCYNTLVSPATLRNTGCDMSCSGNTGEICGGGGRLSVFNNTAYVYPAHTKTVGQYVYQGCYQEAAAGRLLDRSTRVDRMGSMPGLSIPANATAALASPPRPWRFRARAAVCCVVVAPRSFVARRDCWMCIC